MRGERRGEESEKAVALIGQRDRTADFIFGEAAVAMKRGAINRYAGQRLINRRAEARR
jgi:hypothetical protein